MLHAPLIYPTQSDFVIVRITSIVYTIIKSYAKYMGGAGMENFISVNKRCYTYYIPVKN